MEYFSEFDSRSSSSAGVYRQNALYMKIESIFDLEPRNGDPSEGAVAIHAHEYVHFLHNVSTNSGLFYLLNNLILIRQMVGGCDESGHFLGIDKIQPAQAGHLLETVSVMNDILGDTNYSFQGSSNDVLQWDCLPNPFEGNQTDPACVVAKFNKVCGDIEAELRIGLSFITEGVAYEIDRQIRTLNGSSECELDKNTKIFPYLSYRLLVCSWSGRKISSRDCIAIGITALHGLYPGVMLENICKILKEKPDLPVNVVLEHCRNNCREISNKIRSAFKEQSDDLSYGDAIYGAMKQYMSLVEAGLDIREREWDIENKLVSKKMSPGEFRSIIGSLLDCLVIQSKPDMDVDMYWIGPGVIAQDEQNMQHLGALQSALHFSQIHISGSGGLVPTVNKLSQGIKCPFSGACKSEHDDGHPSECQNSPWMRFKSAEQESKVCWYAAGVKAIRSKSNVSEYYEKEH